MARLIVGSGAEARTIELQPGKPLVVGRDPGVDIPLPEERQASRRHCEVRAVASGGWEVADLGATNKTRVNGAPIDKRALGSGDVIEVGKVTLRFEDPDEEARLAQAGKQGVCLLEYVDGTRKGQRVMLSTARTTLGRRPGNTIVLEDRMASGHHAEVVKDLNGYTIRDLGSTNGILVNGQPTTEAPLAHGTRLRVGGTRFVFRDPSMKEVEVELARLEDDDGWGMMGDIDLSRARVSKAGTLSTVAFLALVGGAGFFLMKETDKPKASGEVAGEQIANGSFEQATLPWSWPDGGSLNVVRSQAAGGGQLEARNDAAEGARPEDVVYDDEIPAGRGRTIDLRAKLRGEGQLLAVWRNDGDRAAGATPVTWTQVLATGASGSVTRRLAFPSWASAVTLKLRVPVGAKLVLDDLSVRATADTPATLLCECPGLPAATVEADGSAAIHTNRTALALAISPFALKGNERLAFVAEAAPVKDDLTVRATGRFVAGATELPGTVAWTSEAEGLVLAIECAGADRVGATADLARAHVGGSLNVLTASDARGIALVPGPVEGELQKVLAGNPKSEGLRPPTLLAVQPLEGLARLAVEDAGEPGMVRLAPSVAGAKGRLLFVTDFSAQAKAAKDALDAAGKLSRTSPGAGIAALRRVAQAYPFEAGVAEEASRQARDLEAKAVASIGSLRESVESFRILGSPATLAEMKKRLVQMRASFPSSGEKPVEGSFDDQIARLEAQAADLERAYTLGSIAPRTQRLTRLAESLAATPGYEAMAALVYRDLADRLTPLLAGSPAGTGLLTRLQEEAARLQEKPGVQQALPPR
jgi:pSer/pThr/pTyr-binding forkhead associated (FHA) protein